MLCDLKVKVKGHLMYFLIRKSPGPLDIATSNDVDGII